MASQIAHVVYALNFLKKSNRKTLNKKMFLLGCTFPDIIRTSDELSKEITHDKFDINLSFDKINSFNSGWKFHIYCDKNREKILKKSFFYEIPDTKNGSYAANKILEDILIYDEYKKHYKKIIPYFYNIPFLNINFIKQSIINKWYMTIAEYISEKPHEKSIRIMLKAFNTPNTQIEEIVTSINILKKNDRVVHTLSQLTKKILTPL